MIDRQTPRPPALDPATVDVRTGTNYPGEFSGPVETREKRALGDALGATPAVSTVRGRLQALTRLAAASARLEAAVVAAEASHGPVSLHGAGEASILVQALSHDGPLLPPAVLQLCAALGAKARPAARGALALGPIGPVVAAASRMCVSVSPDDAALAAWQAAASLLFGWASGAANADGDLQGCLCPDELMGLPAVRRALTPSGKDALRRAAKRLVWPWVRQRPQQRARAAMAAAALLPPVAACDSAWEAVRVLSSTASASRGAISVEECRQVEDMVALTAATSDGAQMPALPEAAVAAAVARLAGAALIRCKADSASERAGVEQHEAPLRALAAALGSWASWALGRRVEMDSHSAAEVGAWACCSWPGGSDGPEGLAREAAAAWAVGARLLTGPDLRRLCVPLSPHCPSGPGASRMRVNSPAFVAALKASCAEAEGEPTTEAVGLWWEQAWGPLEALRPLSAAAAARVAAAGLESLPRLPPMSPTVMGQRAAAAAAQSKPALAQALEAVDAVTFTIACCKAAALLASPASATGTNAAICGGAPGSSTVAGAARVVGELVGRSELDFTAGARSAKGWDESLGALVVWWPAVKLWLRALGELAAFVPGMPHGAGGIRRAILAAVDAACASLASWNDIGNLPALPAHTGSAALARARRRTAGALPTERWVGLPLAARAAAPPAAAPSGSENSKASDQPTSPELADVPVAALEALAACLLAAEQLDRLAGGNGGPAGEPADTARAVALRLRSLVADAETESGEAAASAARQRTAGQGVHAPAALAAILRLLSDAGLATSSESQRAASARTVEDLREAFGDAFSDPPTDARGLHEFVRALVDAEAALWAQTVSSSASAGGDAADAASLARVAAAAAALLCWSVADACSVPKAPGIAARVDSKPGLGSAHTGSGRRVPDAEQLGSDGACMAWAASWRAPRRRSFAAAACDSPEWHRRAWEALLGALVRRVKARPVRGATGVALASACLLCQLAHDARVPASAVQHVAAAWHPDHRRHGAASSSDALADAIALATCSAISGRGGSRSMRAAAHAASRRCSLVAPQATGSVCLQLEMLSGESSEAGAAASEPGAGRPPGSARARSGAVLAWAQRTVSSVERLLFGELAVSVAAAVIPSDETPPASAEALTSPSPTNSRLSDVWSDDDWEA